MIEMYLTIGILALTFGLLIFSKLPPAAIFVGALTLTITFKLAPLTDSLKGFNNPGVLTVGALFMIAAGMYSTGAISILSDKLIGRPKSVLQAQLKILPNTTKSESTPPFSTVKVRAPSIPLIGTATTDERVAARNVGPKRQRAGNVDIAAYGQLVAVLCFDVVNIH